MEFHTFLEHQVESSRLAETLALQSLDRLMMAKQASIMMMVSMAVRWLMPKAKRWTAGWL